MSKPAYRVVFTEEELKKRKGKFGSVMSIYDRKKFEKEFDVRSLHLNKEMLKIWYENPHIRQVFVNRRKFIRNDREFTHYNRIVTKYTPRTKYQRRIGEVKTVEHWGQRKLLMSEIEFLTNYASKGDLVVYAGSAPGTHTNYLSEYFFPDIDFVLIDPSPFHAVPSDKIKIRKEYFTDKTAEEFKDRKNIVFISDIRSVEFGLDDEQKEKRVKQDMEMQKGWHLQIKPKASMFKFRLPYTPGKTKYFNGYIYFPVWGGRTTSETRLVVTSDKMKEYDHTDYEDIMFHFNTVTRTTYYPHNVKAEGLDHCYDCRSEVFILDTYLRKVRGLQGNLNKEIAELSENISKNISRKGRTLKI